MTRQTATVGFLHSGPHARLVFEGELAGRFRGRVRHALAPCEGEEQYPELLLAARKLAGLAGRIVLGCPGHDACAAWLVADLGVPVERSDAAGARALVRTDGPIGVLAGDAERPVVVDYLSAVLAQAEQSREIRASALLSPLRDCAVLFVPRGKSELEGLDAVRAARRGPVVSALQATLDELLDGTLRV